MILTFNQPIMNDESGGIAVRMHVYGCVCMCAKGLRLESASKLRVNIVRPAANGYLVATLGR